MKLIHCSDVHLGASMTTHLKETKANSRRMELLNSFYNLVNFAKREQVEGILIAGDLLDTEFCDFRVTESLIEIFESNPCIQFYYLAGNHDENSLLLTRARDITNLHIFGADWTKFLLNGIRITGAVLGENNSSLYSSLSLDPNEFNIVVLHGGIVGGKDYSTPDTVNIDALKNKNIDYLALGHYHTYSEDTLDKRGEYVYSGCLEGRGFDECGQKGFVLLDITEAGITHTFIPFGKRQLHEITVNISKLNTLPDFTAELAKQLDKISEDDFVRVNFVGEFNEISQKNIHLSTINFENKFYHFEYKDKTTPCLDLEELEKDISIKGEFIRAVRKSGISLEEQNEIIMLGLNALDNKEVE